MQKVAIVGGGILGLALGYEMSLSKYKYKVCIFEKENTIGCHQSGNNSGVLHCGLYYKPGSLKAKLAVDGIRQMISFCEENNIDHEVCGKVVIASNEYEAGLLDHLAARGEQNGLNGLRLLSRSELLKREPNAKSFKTLLVPEEGIVDYRQVMNALAAKIIDAGGQIELDCKVTGIKQATNNQLVLQSQRNEQAFDRVINCTGLHTDRIYKQLTGNQSPIKIVPFRGEYMQFTEKYRSIVNHLIYPVPDPAFPFLGAHFTRMINGAREVGPNAVLALKREGYKKTDFSFNDTVDSLTYKGFLNFFRKNTSFAMGEFLSSLSTHAFVSKAKKLIPDVEKYMFEKGGTAGVRAQAISPEGDLIMDFQIAREKNQIHILNAPSPGATASLAIAKHIVDKYIAN